MSISIIYKKIDFNIIKFNLLNLHTRIRFFESFFVTFSIQIACQKWQIKKNW